MILFIVLVFLLGITTGIPIGLVLDDFFHCWSQNVVRWIYKRFGKDAKNG